MPRHDYTPQEALRRLIDKVAARDEQLATQVLAAVNAGRDVQEVERQGKKKSRLYRHTVAFTPEEALGIALEVLRAHFVEQPRLVNSCLDDMRFAALGPGAAPSKFFAPLKIETTKPEEIEKTVEIELQTETEIIPTGTALRQQRPEVAVMDHLPDDQIREQEENLDHLRQMLDFTQG
jgi:hypothetical protein